MTKDQLLTFLSLHKHYFEREYGVLKLGVFGSYAKDQARENSDIDIAVELKKEHKFKNFFSLQSYLEDHLHKKIDLGIESALKSPIREAVRNEIIYV